MPTITDELEAVFQPTDAPSHGDFSESSVIGLKRLPTGLLQVRNLIPQSILQYTPEQSLTTNGILLVF